MTTDELKALFTDSVRLHANTVRASHEDWQNVIANALVAALGPLHWEPYHCETCHKDITQTGVAYCHECDPLRLGATFPPAAPLVSPPLDQVTATEAGVPCGRCGGPCPYETGLTNEQWNRVIRKGGPEQTGEYLCASCIIEAFVLAGESFRAELSGGKVSGGVIEVRCVGLPVADAQALTDQDDARTSAAPLVSPPGERHDE